LVDEICEIKDERKRIAGLKDEDAFHLAAAIEGKAKYFVTVDDRILARSDKIEQCGIKVRNPVELEVKNGY
jgi:predicted nucleic acid-binding protein